MKPIALLFLLCLISCEYKDISTNSVVPACTPQVVVSFSKDVYQIITAKYASPSCHSRANQSLPYLTTYSEINANAGDIAGRLSTNSMPPAKSPPLTVNEKALIECWIKQGALDN